MFPSSTCWVHNRPGNFAELHGACSFAAADVALRPYVVTASALELGVHFPAAGGKDGGLASDRQCLFLHLVDSHALQEPKGKVALVGGEASRHKARISGGKHALGRCKIVCCW